MRQPRSCAGLLLAAVAALLPGAHGWAPRGAPRARRAPVLAAFTSEVPRVAPAAEGLPWKSSLDPAATLTYMPFLEEMVAVMEGLGMERVEVPARLESAESSHREARISSMHWRGDLFRKVRLTYFDGGADVQVFNSLWYPDPSLDLPLLGVDLLSLARGKRVLSVVDFQPLSQEPEYLERHVDWLKPLRDQFPALHGSLSGKIYDSTQFFSPQMLFGRHADESHVQSSVLPAFRAYLEAYVAHAAASPRDASEETVARVLRRHAEYDDFSASRDPAHGLFVSYFGEAFAEAFVHDFLFDKSERRKDLKPVHTFGKEGGKGEEHR